MMTVIFCDLYTSPLPSYHDIMKLFAVPVLAAFACFAASDAPLSRVQAVYILPMGNGMDQYLANRLTASGVFRVVADPKKADTIFTDKLGETFERRMEELYPPPPPAAPVSTGDKDKDKERDDKDKIKAEEKRNALPMSTLGRGHGNFFLVDRATRGVIWSVYLRPKNLQPDTLNHVADHVVARIKHDMGGKGVE